MNTDTFELEIFYPTKSEKYLIMWVNIQSPNGNFVVGPDHSQLVSLLKDRGKITFKDLDGIEHVVDSYGGIFSVANNNAQIIFEK